MTTALPHRAPCCFRGFYATTSVAVRSLLGSGYIVGVPLVADLSLGSWKAWSVARQFAGQLGIEPPRSGASRYSTLIGAGGCYADLVSYEIDLESMGDRNVDTALDLARLFRRTALEKPFTPIVVLPRFGAAWEDEDVLFLTLLARELEGREIIFFCCDPTPPPLPEIWSIEWQNTPDMPVPSTPDTLALIPQAVPESLWPLGSPIDLASSDHVRVSAGWILVSPEKRREPRSVSKLAWDRFAKAAAAIDPSLSVYGQYHGNNIHIDMAGMTREAWAQFADGGSDIALRYMTRVESCETTLLTKAVARAQKQGMRIARLRFAEAAQEPQPSASLPAPLRSALLQAQGWGLVLVGQAQQARALLREARALLGPEVEAVEAVEASRESLSLFNILALAEIRCGDPSEALSLEKRIEACLERAPSRDFTLAYVNAINQARIYKNLRDWSNAGIYYDKAFAVTWGLRSESDLVYTNVCRARLFEAQGRFEVALLAWVRAALHWLASSRPEALSLRIAQALAPGLPIFGASSRRCVRWVDEISGALLQKLASSASECGRTPTASPQRDCASFARIEETGTAATLSCAIGGSGWSVFAAALDHHWPDRGEAYTQLRSWVSAWIGPPMGLAANHCYIVDSRGGMDMAVSRSELIEHCVRRGVRRARYEGELIEINDALSRRVELESTLQLAPGVDDISTEVPPRVHFKRYREPRMLRPEEAVLVHFARRGALMDQVLSQCPIDALACLEPLEHAGIVHRVWTVGHS